MWLRLHPWRALLRRLFPALLLNCLGLALGLRGRAGEGSRDGVGAECDWGEGGLRGRQRRRGAQAVMQAA